MEYAARLTRSPSRKTLVAPLVALALGAGVATGAYALIDDGGTTTRLEGDRRRAARPAARPTSPARTRPPRQPRSQVRRRRASPRRTRPRRQRRSRSSPAGSSRAARRRARPARSRPAARRPTGQPSSAATRTARRSRCAPRRAGMGKRGAQPSPYPRPSGTTPGAPLRRGACAFRCACDLAPGPADRALDEADRTVVHDRRQARDRAPRRDHATDLVAVLDDEVDLHVERELGLLGRDPQLAVDRVAVERVHRQGPIPLGQRVPPRAGSAPAPRPPPGSRRASRRSRRGTA